MRIALVLRKKKQQQSDEVGQAVVFEVEENKVVGVENDILQTADPDSLSIWALTKKVKEIYIPEADEKIKTFFGNLGIRMKRYDELGNDELFQTFII
ncbi:hypothetical protein [Parabacteroides sp. PF5-9]|uniref:hypothetical protein n=1 Tax=Parabacteroides sp. PF5-9 TaxID=1742404 RepID=UPI002473D412|nr:hypothetical protein [Parabacteroides sp. PF5-9]MDH6356932.1 hypothetical protein [Parabacteroides sp. PF5-9]